MPVPQPKDYALVVGISKYADGGYLEPLNGPKCDVDNFVKWLLSPDGGYVPDNNVNPFKLVSDDEAKVPQISDVVRVVKDLLKLGNGGEQRIGRRLYIFLAGHGVGPDLDEVGLLTVEATEDAPTYVDGRRYANLFRGQAVFEEIVLIMDCCRDFDSELPASVFPFKNKYDPGGAHKVKCLWAYGTGFGRASRERDFSGEVNGIFSYVLMEALRGGAIDGDGRITGASLERYVKKHVKKHMPPGVDQVPEIAGSDDLVLADGYPPASTTVTVQPSVPHESLVVLYGDGFKPVETAPEPHAGGMYRIKLRIGKTYVFQLHNAAGGVLKQTGKAVEDADEVIHVVV